MSRTAESRIPADRRNRVSGRGRRQDGSGSALQAPSTEAPGSSLAGLMIMSSRFGPGGGHDRGSNLADPARPSSRPLGGGPPGVSWVREGTLNRLDDRRQTSHTGGKVLLVAVGLCAGCASPGPIIRIHQRVTLTVITWFSDRRPLGCEETGTTPWRIRRPRPRITKIPGRIPGKGPETSLDSEWPVACPLLGCRGPDSRGRGHRPTESQVATHMTLQSASAWPRSSLQWGGPQRVVGRPSNVSIGPNGSSIGWSCR